MREKRQKVNRVGSPSGTFIFLVLHESKTLEIWRKNSSRSTMIPLLCYLSIAPTLHRIRWREDASCRIGPKQCGKRRGGPSRAREVVTGVVRIMYNKVPTSASYIGTSWKMATTTTPVWHRYESYNGRSRYETRKNTRFFESSAT